MSQVDPQIAHAVSGELESGEFDRPSDITYLKVRYARSYKGLEECKGLRFLLLVGCSTEGVPPLVDHPELVQLGVSDSDVRSIEGIGAAAELHTVDLPRNGIEDLEPLLACPGLLSVDVTGNPLSDHSLKDVLPELRRRGVKVSAPTAEERDLMLRMRSVGLPFAYYHRGESHRLSRPGLGLTDMPEADHIKIEPGELGRLLVEDQATLAAIFEWRDLMPTLNDL